MLNEAITILQKQTHLVTVHEEWSYESVTLEREELDEATLPEGAKKQLPKLVMTHLYLYVDDQDNEYVVYFLTDVTSQTTFIKGLLKNNTRLYSKLLPMKDEAE
ncbi:hypothetical protein IGL98_003135 [Enterococcus sp. DIV0840]|uniref:4'-phosphopantetheinyl transferase n=1 Tax=Enterococcus TaxID=1350 RepID=UPI001A902B46|nr:MULTISPECIES: 4'-phosphopantetheinyl transferase [Enterococcus]MBO0435821.1 4'-phosphopantetheinyl transferase [Enterococcus sp. DIV0849a]MBO0474488.1 4'-phosphopantetheinyl transferase [Enterococcus ureasiticus]